jgi:uroporphyrinogen III methyltransferase/synthase
MSGGEEDDRPASSTSQGRTSGIVFLVGAGPGDPSLLTVRARALLEQCDVVAYDELCSDALLASVPATAQLVSVGRRGHAALPLSPRLHPAILEHARAGRRVVRLKAGDPLVFGRGGEEAEELAAAGVPFEIVPGVSSALGAAAYAGIPLTHRGLASAVTFSTGHDVGDDAAYRHGTVVLFMAGKKLTANLARLVADGRAPTTPAAYVAAATTAQQRVVVGTVADLAARVAAANVDLLAPALVLVGEVVGLHARIGWLARRPLHGRRLLVGRARPGPSQIATALAALGAEVVQAPEIGVAAPSSWEPFDRALAELGGFAALVVASAEAAAALTARLGERGRDLRALPPIPIVAVGARAVAALRARGLPPAVAAIGACAEALAAHDELRRGRLLVIADEDGRPQLASELGALGATVEVAPAYRHRLRWPPLRELRFDLVIAPSSSAALHLGDGPYAAALRPLRWLAMGPVSEAAARRLGVADVTRADHDDVDALVASATELLSA